MNTSNDGKVIAGNAIAKPGEIFAIPETAPRPSAEEADPRHACRTGRDCNLVLVVAGPAFLLLPDRNDRSDAPIVVFLFMAFGDPLSGRIRLRD